MCRRIAAPWRQATECSTWNIPEPEPHAIVPRGTFRHQYRTQLFHVEQSGTGKQAQLFHVEQSYGMFPDAGEEWAEIFPLQQGVFLPCPGLLALSCLPWPACPARRVGSQSRAGGKAGQGATGDRLCWLFRPCMLFMPCYERASGKGKPEERNWKSGTGRAEPEERNCSTWNNSAPCHSQKCSTWNNCVPRWFQNRPREEAELRGIQRWKRAAFLDRTTMELLAVRPETNFRRAAALR